MQDFQFPEFDIFAVRWPWILAAIVGVVYGLKSYMKGGQCVSRARLKGKVVIVTGANSGIGKETAIDLARRGAKVYLACRDEEKGKTAEASVRKLSKNENVFFMKLDLASFKSVRDFAAAFKKKEDQLHILVNNGGIMLWPKSKSEDGFELHMATNYLGTFLLTHLLLDLLKSSAPSRIVCVSATAYQLGTMRLNDINLEEEEYTPGKAYSHSKLALMLFARKLSKELEGTGVTVNTLHPGVVKTQAHRHMPFRSNFFVALCFAPFVFVLMKPAVDGAQTVIHLAVAEELEKVSGKYFVDCEVKDEDPVAKDDETADRLWALTMKWVGLAEADDKEEKEEDENED
ncbi:retinol dehydrogenase 12 [Lingula anatina]|uniref:Retinol dehydrogenase 12 n=1 Tax=Lingula anatina TaxID=7574 RepID=A0A1S3I813_LINAN|nr:retinol dehydrogenase 12 [Lingula anatina]XP_013388718.1 retinol dehydrogenase 12 [Lingula anatina]|eukprot:XP_013388717.1 retinol dehydrogenase 12 [Lingula anatina]